MQNSFLGHNHPVYIDKDRLLGAINQIDAWCDLLGFKVKMGEHFINPWRSDSTAGCYFYEVDGIIRLSDLGSRDKFHAMDICALIMYTENVTFVESLNIVKHRYLSKNIDLSQFTPLPHGTGNSFQLHLSVTPRASYDCPIWTIKDKELWSVIEVDRDDLWDENIWPIHSFRMNSKKQPDVVKKFIPAAPSYVININNLQKLRLYGLGDLRFISTFNANTIGGKSAIINHDLLIVTKSFKDYMVFTKLGFQCRYIHSEGILLSNTLINFFNKFDKVIFFMDNDQAGMSAANRYAKLVKNGYAAHLPELLRVKGITDPYEYCEQYSLNSFYNLITHENFKVIAL